MPLGKERRGPPPSRVQSPEPRLRHGPAERWLESDRGPSKPLPGNGDAADKPGLLHYLQARCGNAAVQRLISDAHEPIVQRYPGVVPDQLDKDRVRMFKDPSGTVRPIWTEDGGYARNPTSTRLSSIVKNGKVGGDFANGRFMYVVEEDGTVWVGKRMTTTDGSLPHPTLLGGKNPQVRSAGMVQVQGGKIVEINNHSGHFAPPRTALKHSVDSFLQLDARVFKNLSVSSVHVDEKGVETFKKFRSGKLLKLKMRDWWKFTKKFKWASIKGRFRSRSFRSSAKGIGGLLAVLLTQYLLAKWMEDITQEQIRKDLEKLEPKVQESLEKALEAEADEFDALLEEDPDAEIYVNVRYRIGMWENTDPDPYGPGSTETYWETELVDVAFSRKPSSTKSTYEREQTGCVSAINWETVTVSERIPVKELFE